MLKIAKVNNGKAVHIVDTGVSALGANYTHSICGSGVDHRGIGNYRNVTELNLDKVTCKRCLKLHGKS